MGLVLMLLFRTTLSSKVIRLVASSACLNLGRIVPIFVKPFSSTIITHFTCGSSVYVPFLGAASLLKITYLFCLRTFYGS